MKKRQYVGTVRRIEPAQGYGFIRCVELGKDVFFHISRGELIVYDPARREIVGDIEEPPGRNPESGDIIIFDFEARGPGRDRASHWGLQTDYLRALAQMEKAT